MMCNIRTQYTPEHGHHEECVGKLVGVRGVRGKAKKAWTTPFDQMSSFICVGVV